MINVKRLEKLITALEDAKPENFCMGDYGTVQNGCGTPACVLGHYAARRDLQRSFVLKPSSFCPSSMDVLTNKKGFVDYESEEVREHFGINSFEAHALFSGEGCDFAQTPKQAIRYIKRFIKKNS